MNAYSQRLGFGALLLSLALFLDSCAVTGPRVTPQEEATARTQIQAADLRIWWAHQKRLYRIGDHFVWRVKTPGAPYRNGLGILPVLRKSASPDKLALYRALGNPPDGTVLHVSSGSPADKAGIQEGDLIIAINERNVSTLSVGDLVEFAYKGRITNFSFRKHIGGELKTVGLTPEPMLNVTFAVDRAMKVNAFATKYGDTNLVMFYYGLLNVIPTDDELAVFVGHEVVHILKHHQDQSAVITGIGSLVELSIAIVGAARGIDTTSIRRGVSTITEVVNRRYSREQEREADYLGLYAANQAGFDIESAKTAWERFAVATPDALNDNFFSDHPPNPERLARIQKTIEEIQQGRTLQEVWNGDFSDVQVASTAPANSRSATTRVANSGGTGPIASAAAAIPSPTPAAPMAMTSLAVSPTVPAEPRQIRKTYASLILYDGPKVKAGVTLDAQFLDDGSGKGEAVVSDIRNQTLRGTFITIKPGDSDLPKPKVLDRATLNKLQIRNDQPWYISTVSNGDTVLECVYGSTLPLNQKKGDCRDNYGNRYHLTVAP